jgi:hypothetical protein
MDTFEIVMFFVNKTMVSKEASRWAPGNQRLQAILLKPCTRWPHKLLNLCLKAVINGESTLRKVG